MRPVFELPQILVSIGMTPMDGSSPGNYLKSYHVMLDGSVLGWVPDKETDNFIDQLRLLKVKQIHQVHESLI